MRQSSPLLVVIVGLATALFFATIISIAPSRANIDPFPQEWVAPGPIRAPTLEPRDPCLVSGAPCTWSRTFGGALEDKAFAVAATQDNAIFLAGHTRSFTGAEYDGWILRLDATGRMLWERHVGGPGSDQLFGLVATDDGGVVVAGHSRLGRGYRGDAWVARLDRNGRVVWNRLYGDPGREDRANAIAATEDGGFVVAGFTQSAGSGSDDAWVFRLDADGRMVWDRTLGTPHNEGAHSIAVGPGGAITVAGYAFTPDERGYDATIHRLSANGALVWERRIHQSRFDVASAVAAHQDGGVLVVGLSAGERLGRETSWAMRLNALGTEMWRRSLSGPGNDLAHSVLAMRDGGFVLALGSSSRGAGSTDAWVVRLDPVGGLAWERTHGGLLWDRPAGLAAMSDGGVVLTGTTTTSGAGYEDFWLLRLDADGNL